MQTRFHDTDCRSFERSIISIEVKGNKRPLMLPHCCLRHARLHVYRECTASMPDPSPLTDYALDNACPTRRQLGRSSLRSTITIRANMETRLISPMLLSNRPVRRIEPFSNAHKRQIKKIYRLYTSPNIARENYRSNYHGRFEANVRLSKTTCARSTGEKIPL